MKYFSWSVAATLIVAYFVLLYIYAVNIPIGDDYDNVFAFYLNYDHANTPAEIIHLFFSQHNEHRLAFNRLVYFFERSLFGQTNLVLLIFIGNLALVGIFALFVYSYHKTLVYPLAVMFSAMLIFLPLQYENMVWAMASLSNFYVLFFAFLSLVILTAKPTALHFYGALIFACISLYTQANGLSVLLVGAIYLTWQYIIRQRPARDLVIWSVISLLAVGFYFYGYIKPPHHPSVMDAIIHPLDTLTYFFVFIGSSVSYLGGNAPPTLGVMIFLIFLYLTYRRYFIRRPAIYAFLLFLFGSAGMTALGRAGFGIEQAVSSRYIIISSCILLIATLSMLDVLKLRKNWQLYVSICLSLLFIGHTYIAYITNMPNLEKKKQALTEGVAVLHHHQAAFGLEHPIKIHAKNVLHAMQAKGYYQIPQDIIQNASPLLSQGANLKVTHHLLSAKDYNGPKMAHRLNGSMIIQVHNDEFIRLEGWLDIPDSETEKFMLLALPVTPNSVFGKSVRRVDVAENLKRTDLYDSGFEIVVTFPHGTDLHAIANNLCLAYQSSTVPMTLITNNPPICKQRLFEAEQ